MNTQYDVVVFGGGTAGTIAAIQAGRAGARTLLVEKNGMLGGTMTVAGINAPATFFAWGRQITGGIGWELIRKSFEEMRLPVPNAEGTHEKNSPKAVFFDICVFTALCDEAAIKAGVDLLFHSMPASVVFENGKWSLCICTKSGLRRIQAKVIIDATGDANAVSLAGHETIRPETVQPGTLQMKCAGYDPSALDYTALKLASQQAIASGELKSTDISWYNAGPESFLRRYGFNANHVRTPGAETSEGRTSAEIEARQSLLRICRFFRRQPGLENFHIPWFCPEVGIRETVTIKGKKTVTVQDYESGNFYNDAVCYAFYPVDEHLHDGLGINYRPLGKYVLPTIPRGAMLPVGSRYLIVAGRCISSDREANSALRVECPCMAMGQAAGAMAAISAANGTDPEDLEMSEIYALLRKHGAIIPEKTPAG